MKRNRKLAVSNDQGTRRPTRGSLWHNLVLGVAIATFAVTAALLFGPLVWPGS